MSRPMFLELRFPLILATAFAASACTTDSPSAPKSRDVAPNFGQVQQNLQGLYIVEANGATAGIVAAIRQAGGTVRADVPQIGMVSVAGLDAKGAAAIGRRSDVVGVYHDAMTNFVLPKRVGLPLQAGNPRTQGPDQSGAFFFPAQWNIPITRADKAWRQTTSGVGRTVWVLDTGYDPFQIDLKGHTYCYSTGITVPRFQSDQTIYDFNFHGSFVSSLIATNGLGMASIAPSARVCTRKVLSEDGVGTFADVAAAIVYAADHGANVINMSLGAYFDRHSEGAGALIGMMQKAVDFANRRGAVVVAAAGNSAINLDKDGSMIAIPAQLNRVISVGATGPDLSFNYDALASYSNYGGETGVDLVAPGGDLPDPNNAFDLILGACSTFVCGAPNFYVLAAGTSFSAPHVSAAAAIVQATLGGAPSPAAVEQCIEKNANKVGDPLIFGHGRLNVLRANLC